MEDVITFIFAFGWATGSSYDLSIGKL